MPYANYADKLAYQSQYQKSDKEVKKRVNRNKARRLMIKKGAVQKGSAMDVHHKDRNTNNNRPSNLKIEHQSKNRGDNK